MSLLRDTITAHKLYCVSEERSVSFGDYAHITVCLTGAIPMTCGARGRAGGAADGAGGECGGARGAAACADAHGLVAGSGAAGRQRPRS